ncbi:MAG: hypothetical protein EA376_05365 [Phycisphaeraceae bacterium]|nr:MAG: hypothetical protein EA376_05365 [Phycisphaeraceae bacterium]
MQGRSKLRLVGCGALLAVFLASAWVGWFAAHRVAATPAPEWDANDRLNELVASRQPEGANAWPIYERIIRDALEVDEVDWWIGNDLHSELRALLMQRPLLGAWSDPVWTKQRASFEALRPVLEMLNDLDGAPGCARPYLPPPEAMGGLAPGVMTLFPELGNIRRVAILNVVGLRAAAAEEDWDEVVLRFRVGRAMARHLTHQATLIEWMVSGSMAAMLFDELGHILLERQVPASVCERLLDAFDDHPWPGLPMMEMLSGERIFMEDFVQWIYSPGENGILVQWALLSIEMEWPELFNSDTGGVAAPGMSYRLTGLNPALFVEPRRGEVMRIIDEMFTEVESRAAPDALERTIDDSLFTRAISRSRLIERLLSSTDRAFNNVRSAMTTQKGLEIMLRLELHRARTGAWPESLEQAMAPAQTLDPVTGQPIEFERVEDDEHGRPYILRAPDEYTHLVRLPHWPELNTVREPIPDAMREAWEAEQEGGDNDL